jgi:hypothetical protein
VRTAGQAFASLDHVLILDRYLQAVRTLHFEDGYPTCAGKDWRITALTFSEATQTVRSRREMLAALADGTRLLLHAEITLSCGQVRPVAPGVFRRLFEQATK